MDERLALDASGPGLRLSNVRFTLCRRVVEILDGMRVLPAWSTDEAVEAVTRQLDASASPLSAAERQAVVTAAVPLDAGRRLQAARVDAARTRQARPVAPDVPVAALPGEDTAAYDERSRLELVAGHLRHPLVLAALKELRSKNVDFCAIVMGGSYGGLFAARAHEDPCNSDTRDRCCPSDRRPSCCNLPTITRNKQNAIAVLTVDLGCGAPSCP
ncbi:hypothetical protein GTW71_27985 [Streptomyces sp. SID6041]|nr:hypothetical protein [Streptomyces sp. SID6041]